jgi:hypothetical protein
VVSPHHGEKSKVQSIEMKFLRAIAGKTRIDGIRNAYIRGEQKAEDIQN